MVDDYFRTVKSLPMPQYLMHDWTPATGMSLEAWAHDLFERGWRDWCGPGNWITVNGERRFRVSLRRSARHMKAERKKKLLSGAQ